jgi:hypothetical protein
MRAPCRRRLPILAALVTCLAGCGPSAARPDAPPLPAAADAWLVVSNLPAAGWVLLRVDGAAAGQLGPGEARQLGPFPPGARALGVAPLGRPFRDFAVTLTSGGTTRFVIPQDATEGGEAPPEPAPEPAADPAVEPAAPPAPPAGDAPPPETKRPPRRPPRERGGEPRPPAEAPPEPTPPTPPGPAEAPPDYAPAPAPAPAPPAERGGEPEPPPGRAWLVVENRSPGPIVVSRDGSRLGRVPSGGSQRFAVPPAAADYRAQRDDGAAVETRRMAVAVRTVWRIEAGTGRLVVVNPAAEPFEVQVAGGPARTLAPGARLSLEVWSGLVPVRVVGQVSGRRMEARVAVAAGGEGEWRTPIVKGGLGIRNGRSAPLPVTVDGEPRGAVPPGAQRWFDLPVGDHAVVVGGGAAGGVERRTLRIVPGRETTWDVR